jgi:hypothetical protein
MKRKYCKYCKRKITKLPTNDIFGSCFICNTDYYTNGTVNIFCEIKKRTYYFQYRPKSSSRIIEDENANCVLEFNTIPNITPTNIVEKLKLYLLFS